MDGNEWLKHLTYAQLLWYAGGLTAVLLSMVGAACAMVVKKVNKAADQIDSMATGQTDTSKKALDYLKEIHDIQGVQAENHLKTIQDTNIVIKDEAIKTNAKLDTLISVMSKKA